MRAEKKAKKINHEAVLQAEIASALQAAGHLCWIHRVDNRRGIKTGLGEGTADIIGIQAGTGRFFGLEVKRRKTKTPPYYSPSAVKPAQIAWGKIVRERKGIHAIVTSVEEALIAVEVQSL